MTELLDGEFVFEEPNAERTEVSAPVPKLPPRPEMEARIGRIPVTGRWLALPDPTRTHFSRLASKRGTDDTSESGATDEEK